MGLCDHLEPSAYSISDEEAATTLVHSVSSFATQLLPYAACAAGAVLVNIAILPFAHNTGQCINDK